MATMNNTRIAVTSRSFSKHPILRAELKARYPAANITFNDKGKSLAGDDLITYLRGHEKAITALEELDTRVFSKLPELKVISKYGVGLDMLDLDAMETHGVQLGWKGGVNRRSVSELVIASAIMLLRHVPAASREVIDGVWQQHKGTELSGRTFGIIGCGRVGKDLVVLLNAFGCRVLASDIKDYPTFYSDYDVMPVDLDTLLGEADIVTLHTPLDASTRNILTADRLALMRPSAILINAARGGLVDEDEVKKMLMDGRLSGAAFDVFATEPPEDHELLQLPNFLVTPHIGGSSEEAILAMGRAAIDGLQIHGNPKEVASAAAPDGLNI